jgi:hypothetical protein
MEPFDVPDLFRSSPLCLWRAARAIPQQVSDPATRKCTYDDAKASPHLHAGLIMKTTIADFARKEDERLLFP